MAFHPPNKGWHFEKQYLSRLIGRAWGCNSFYCVLVFKIQPESRQHSSILFPLTRLVKARILQTRTTCWWSGTIQWMTDMPRLFGGFNICSAHRPTWSENEFSPPKYVISAPCDQLLRIRGGGRAFSRDTFEDAPCFSEHFIKKGIIVNTCWNMFKLWSEWNAMAFFVVVAHSWTGCLPCWEKQKARTLYHYHLWIENATNITISQKGLNYFKTSAEHIFKISSASWNWFHKFYPTFTMIENQPPPDKFEKCTWFNFQSGSFMCKPFGHLYNRGKLLFLDLVAASQSPTNLRMNVSFTYGWNDLIFWLTLKGIFRDISFDNLWEEENHAMEKF